MIILGMLSILIPLLFIVENSLFGSESSKIFNWHCRTSSLSLFIFYHNSSNIFRFKCLWLVKIRCQSCSYLRNGSTATFNLSKISWNRNISNGHLVRQFKSVFNNIFDKSVWNLLSSISILVYQKITSYIFIMLNFLIFGLVINYVHLELVFFDIFRWLIYFFIICWIFRYYWIYIWNYFRLEKWTFK